MFYEEKMRFMNFSKNDQKCSGGRGESIFEIERKWWGARK